MMFCLICTGGVGSGKSYTAKIFSRLGIPAYIADIRTKELYSTDKGLLNELTALLGDEIIAGGVLRRDVMASKIFGNPYLLKKVNEIVHPKVLADYEKWRGERRREGVEIVLFESAIFFESPMFHHIADKIMVVFAPLEVRINRVMRRDGLSRDQVMERIRSQISDEERMRRADYIVYTDGKRAVLPQLLNVLESINLIKECR